MRINQAWWLNPISIRGFEGEEGAAGAESGDQGAAAGDAGSTEGVAEGSTASDAVTTDTEGLKKALAAERLARKAADKQVAAYTKAEKVKSDAELTEVERLKGVAEASTAKATKLAAGFRTTRIEQAVVRAATAAKFIDPSDALTPAVLASIGVEQDEDDPTEVTIDEATVQAAIKKLAKDRPHWISSGVVKPAAAVKSGSSFSGAARATAGTDADKAQMMKDFPALRR